MACPPLPKWGQVDAPVGRVSRFPIYLSFGEVGTAFFAVPGEAK